MDLMFKDKRIASTRQLSRLPHSPFRLDAVNVSSLKEATDLKKVCNLDFLTDADDKYLFKVSNKDTGTTSTVVYSSAFIVDFEQVFVLDI